MSIANRPYVGSWQMNKTLVQYATDCIVLVNGTTEISTCPACNKSLELGKYITQVSVDASTDPISTANITLAVPKHSTDVFSYDGNYILQPSLEVVILMRGYFPMRGIAAKGDDAEAFVESVGNVDAAQVPVYPYYQVFRGVVTNVSHDFSGGFYNATLQCANLLHFWQNLKLSVNGAVFGKRPDKSMVEPNLIGHKFTNTNPFSIIYTLVKVGFGAAYGVEFQFSKTSNIAATDDDGRRTLYAHAAEWWQKRWTEHSGNLRMYGIDGSIFNAFEQAYLGAWYDTRNESNGTFYKTTKQVYTALTGSNDYNTSRFKKALEAARVNNWNPLKTSAALYGTGDGPEDFATEDVLRMLAFNFDISKLGAVNTFETEYMSKLEIAEAVKTITGYEFFQDVDGDLVFKPPMYNLDTRDDPVFRIADRDLISINETEGEPEATMMKGTGSHFANVSGTGLDGWLGVGGVFIDYRLVAKYGYREETFETNYMSNRHAIFVSAMNRLDIANAGVQSANIVIPLRPELRPGYPVYIEHLDCFYYAQSLSHSFAFGGQCTTSISGIAKRTKFLPPMQSSGDGGFPGIENVRLDAPNEFPSQPLIGYPNRMAVGSPNEDQESGGPPRIWGFPNVVLAFDPNKANLDTIDSSAIISAEGYVEVALASGFLERVPGNPLSFYLRLGNTNPGAEISINTIQAEWNNAREALAQGTYEPELNTTLGKIIDSINRRTGGADTPNMRNLVNYLVLQNSLKGLFSPGTSAIGRYRYYSCSHPVPAHQGPGNFVSDPETPEGFSIATPDAVEEGFSQTNMVFTSIGDGKGVGLKPNEGPTRGIKIAAFTRESSSKGKAKTEYRTVSTADIRFVTFGPHQLKRRFQVSEVREGWSRGANFRLAPKGTTGAMASLLRARVDSDQSLSAAERFSYEYGRLLAACDSYAANLAVSDKAGVVEVRGNLSSSNAAIQYFFFGSSDPSVSNSDLGTAEALYNFKKSDPDAVSALANGIASALWAYLSAIQSSILKGSGQNEDVTGDYETLMKYRAEFISDYTDGDVVVPDSSAGRINQTSEGDVQEVADHTPIFPVSDEAGYTVVGNLPYGRGIDITRYADLLQSTKTGEATESLSFAAQTEETVVGASGSNAASLDAIEKFYVAYRMRGVSGVPSTAADILAKFDKAERDAILATLNTTLEGIDNIVETIAEGETTGKAKIRNNPVTSFFRGQSVFGDTAARNLADLDVEGTICKCRGFDGNFLIQAYSERWVDIGREQNKDPVQVWMEEQVYTSGEQWKNAKNAISGRVLDTRFTNLAAEFTARGDLARSLTGAAGATGASFEQSAEEAARIAANLADEIEDL